MRTPTTIRGYIALIRKIELISPTLLKGFDKLPDKEKEILDNLSAEISNHINEIQSYKN